LEHWIKTLSESKVEQIELSGEGQSGVIGLEDLVSGKQRVRFQEHSVRALRCSIARTLLVGSFRDFAARLADSPLLQRYSTWLPEEDMREVINGLLRKAGAAIAECKQVLDLEEPLDLSTMFLDTTCVKANIHFPVDWVLLRDGVAASAGKRLRAASAILTGRTLEATIDVWAARHLQRLGYEGHMKK
jgi:hypothetical protein